MLKIIETPRDAMQGIKEFIPTQQKVEFINALFRVGYEAIDVGSFVSPKAIPQLADTAEVLQQIDIAESKTKVMVTVGSLHGAERAMEFEMIDQIAFPYSMSASFLKLNINSNPIKVMKTVVGMLNLCAKHHKELVLYNAMAFGNAYGDDWSAELVVKDTEILKKEGANNVILSDTIAVGTPTSIGKTFELVIKEFPDMEIGAHLHTTPDDWHENVKAAWDMGCRRFDVAIHGRGGCPMSKRKMVGNLDTLNLIQFLKDHDVKTGFDNNAFNDALQKVVPR